MITPIDINQNVRIGGVAGALYQHTHDDSVHLTLSEKKLLKTLQEQESEESSEGESSTSNIQTQLNNKADIDDIPTKVSQLQNDMNFLTEIPDYYTTEEEVKLMITNSGESSQEILKGNLIESISIDDLDKFSDDLASTTQETSSPNTAKYFVVTDKAMNSQDVVVGTMRMFTDVSRHVLIQVLDTQCLLADGEISSSHRDDSFFTYYRYLNVAAPGISDVESGHWSKWSLYNSYTDECAFMGIANPSTNPVTPKYGRRVCYVAVTPGTYTNFDYLGSDPVQIAEGEVALIIGNNAGTETIWSKTTLFQK